MDMKYRENQIVLFSFNGEVNEGEIMATNTWKTSGMDICYDIYSNEKSRLFKHVPERDIIKII